MKKPIIGITCDFYEEKSKKKRVKPRQVYSLGRSYVRAVIEAGGIPILLGGAANVANVKKYIIPRFMEPKSIRKLTSSIQFVKNMK